MPSQCQSKTPQPTHGHVCNYSQVVDEELVILTDDSTDTEEHKAECKAKCEEAKRWKVEEEQLEAEWKKRAEEEAQKRRAMEEEEACKKRAAEEEAERQRQRASQERAQARWDEAAQRLTGTVYNVNTTQKAAERYVAVHEKAATAFERMARAAEQMVEAAEQTANKWGLYCEWVEWVEMRRREDVQEARMAELECRGGGWKRPQLEAEDKNEEADEGAEGDNKEEEEVGGEKEGREEQEGGGEQAMEE
ncbi:hypothetical protein M404DRAFT_31327 [Pisolithus tinctorius Marx 270]|uniref:Uncharacterized protein n=1 Tax=Pisolithus tinctorius Marx 270 TaxID=870435 RepID=A0A0C3NT97_PISTI|nr:hypothetical protein M404DRAFT_31327 [Pisolithus tinctorius Marx 270]